MIIIIAEKPSVALDIAAIVGATQKKEGYMEGGGYAVTWAFGHLVGLAMPEQYGITGFQRENLPIKAITYFCIIMVDNKMFNKIILVIFIIYFV